MSTNYFAITAETPEGDEGLHIGQHAAGSVFQFRAHTDRALTSARAWYRWMEMHDALILSESRTPIDRDDFWADAQECLLRGARERFVGLAVGQTRRASYGGDEWLDELGYSFADYEFC